MNDTVSPTDATADSIAAGTSTESTVAGAAADSIATTVTGSAADTTGSTAPVAPTLPDGGYVVMAVTENDAIYTTIADAQAELKECEDSTPGTKFRILHIIEEGYLPVQAEQDTLYAGS